MSAPTTLWIACLLATAGCSTAPGVYTDAGTAAHLSGTICGQQVDAAIADRKDRSQASLEINCGEGRSVVFTSADSSTSAVITAMASVVQQLSDLTAKLASTAAGRP